MANRDTPMGMRALRNPNGSHPPVRQYVAATPIIFEGELVQLSNTGLAVAIGAAVYTSLTRNILGVAAAPKPAHTTAQITAQAPQSKVQVYVDPDQLYVMQSDDASLDSRTDYIGRNFALTNHDDGNTTTLQSIAEIDGSLGSSASFTGATVRPVQVVELFKQVNNVAVTGGTASSNADFVVRILPRYHMFAGSVGK